MRKLSGKEIALSGISAALAIVFILGAVYVPNLTLSCYVLSAISISLPLIKNLFISSLFSYIVSSVIAFILASTKMLPFIFFFGLYALIIWLLDFRFLLIEKIAKWIKITTILVVKIGYFFGVFFGCFYLMKLTVTDFSFFGKTLQMGWLILIAFVIFVLYDFVYREIFKIVQKKLINKL